VVIPIALGVASPIALGVAWLPTGPPGTKERWKFDCTVRWPIYAAVKFMKSV